MNRNKSIIKSKTLQYFRNLTSLILFFLFTFNLNAQITEFFYLDSAAFKAGYVTHKAEKYDDSRTYMNFGRGCCAAKTFYYLYFKFNISSIPSGSIINNVQLSHYKKWGRNDPRFDAIIRKLDVDPEVSDGATLYPKIHGAFALTQYALQTMSGEGEHRYFVQLNNYAISDLQNAVNIGNGYFSVSLDHQSEVEDQYFRISNQYENNEDLKTYLVITYTPQGCVKPTIVQQPTDIADCEGKDVSLKVVAENKEPLTYQWKKDADIISGATNSEFTITNIKKTDSGNYTCNVMNSCDTVTSDISKLIITGKPEINFISPDKNKCLRDSTLFKVIANDAESYQWYKDNNILTDKTDSQFIIPGLTQTNSGIYNCVISNKCGNSTSANSVLTVNQPPQILNEISDTTTCENNYLEFYVETNAGEYSYQWIKNGENITNATNSIYIINQCNKNDEGIYSCAIFKNCEPVYLKPFTLTIIQKPIINVSSVIQFKLIGDNIKYSLSPGGTPPFEYQWILNDNNIEGATLDFYEKISINYSDTGLYKCLIKNSCGQSLIDIATLRITISGFNVEGTVTYFKNNYTLKNVKIILKNTENIKIDSTTTDVNGYYKFKKLSTNDYILEFSNPAAWAGVNPVDALICIRNYLSMYKINDPLQRKTADVDDDNKITPIDALLINRRYLGIIKKFKIADWLYDTYKFTIINNNLQVDIKAICAGDVNASFPK
ncbi:MAG: immunoglobulin domain-containing protein [Bacteroidales bacterium]|nr:immunoglobulin domain-containing protein [Bacteroidales bacterium]